MNILRKVYNLLNAVIRKGFWYNNVKFTDCKKFWTYTCFNTDIVNLGSTSAVNAFNYTGIPLKCANWALKTNPLTGDLAILKNYLSYLKSNNATVLIPICPFSSLSGRYKITEDKYYTILYPASIPNYSYKKHQQIKCEMHEPIRIYPLWCMFSDLRNIFKKKKNIILSETEMQIDAKNWMNNWMKEFGITDFSYQLSLINQDAIEDAAKILNEIISLCKERNIKPKLLVPPVYHSLGILFSTEIKNKIIDSLINKIEDKSIWYHNYMDDEDFANNSSLFQNSFLLNEKGALLFTKRVMKDLELI